MPPPVPNHSKRMTANPARPVARYRPGKPAVEKESSDEDEASPEEQEQQQKAQRKPQARPQRQQTAPQLEDSEDEDEEGFVTDPEDEDEHVRPQGTTVKASTRSTAYVAQAESIQRPPQPSSSGGEDEDAESSEESESEEEEESSSEEEAPQRKFQRPTFIKKSDRKNPQSTPAPATTAVSQSSESTQHPPPTAELDEQTRRLAQADLLIKDKLERDLIARAQGKKAWDDDDDLAAEDLVDDTDGLDPEAEYAAWKVRELKRLKRDREALIAREKEIEETERRRNLTAEEREKEDREFLDRQKQERDEGRTEASYLARYHHKGAFFQGDEAAEVLKRRDVMGARFEDQVSDKSVLPEYMRLRDMTKLGKKGRTRYTDLKGQDTGRFGEDVKRWRGSGGGQDRFGGGSGTTDFDTRGLDERFLPDDHRGARDSRDGGSGPTGANASIVGARRDAERGSGGHSQSRDRSRDRHRTDERSHDGHRGRRRSYSRSRSHSYSPPRRKHSRSHSPVARKRRQVDDFRDRSRERERNRHRDKDRDRYDGRERETVRSSR